MTDSSKVNEFIDRQLSQWPMAAKNFAALQDVKLKEFDVDGMHIKVQFNPARIVSSAAKVDTNSIKERKCFLCAENRPGEQIARPWGGKYEILVNPFPIFPRHLTIPDTTHIPQAIKGRMSDMIELARDLKEYTVFYNGPKCGASAPDHMHFQAGNSDFLTLAENLESIEQKVILEQDGSILSLVDKYPLKFFIIDARDSVTGELLFNKLYDAMSVNEGDSEPMLNILAYSTPVGVRVVVIPRKRHRPSFYGTEGSDCMLLSPASVDMGGVFITPRSDDFKKLDSDVVLKVFDELCLTQAEVEEIASKL